jgi:hypothetical protein
LRGLAPVGGGFLPGQRRTVQRGARDHGTCRRLGVLGGAVSTVGGLVSPLTGSVALVTGLIAGGASHVSLPGYYVALPGGCVPIVAGLIASVGGLVALVAGLIALLSGLVSIVGGLVWPLAGLIALISGLVALAIGMVALHACLVAPIISVVALLGEVAALVLTVVALLSHLIARRAGRVAFFRSHRPSLPGFRRAIPNAQSGPPGMREPAGEAVASAHRRLRRPCRITILAPDTRYRELAPERFCMLAAYRHRHPDTQESGGSGRGARADTSQARPKRVRLIIGVYSNHTLRVASGSHV